IYEACYRSSIRVYNDQMGISWSKFFHSSS
ncbi:hypothetical protein TNCT_521751, partial [Trichonephila clavata]